MASMLLAREIPPQGGDTLFASMTAAYDALTPGMQRLLEGLVAVNSSAKADVTRTREDRVRSDGRGDARREYVAEHPVVRRHPETGRKALYVNVAHTVRFAGMTEAESKPLLGYLVITSYSIHYTKLYDRVGQALCARTGQDPVGARAVARGQSRPAADRCELAANARRRRNADRNNFV